MKRIIALAGLLFAASLAWSGPALAQGNACAGGAIPGMVVGGTSGACYYIKVNPDGSIATDSVPAGSGTSYASSAALAANQVVKASAGSLYSFNVTADSTLAAAAWWIMVYDLAAAPVDGAVTPAKCYGVPLGTTSVSGAFPNPVAFATGIVIGVSTTGCFTKTASTHAFISGDFK